SAGTADRSANISAQVDVDNAAIVDNQGGLAGAPDDEMIVDYPWGVLVPRHGHRLIVDQFISPNRHAGKPKGQGESRNAGQGKARPWTVIMGLASKQRGA